MSVSYHFQNLVWKFCVNRGGPMLRPEQKAGIKINSHSGGSTRSMHYIDFSVMLHFSYGGAAGELNTYSRGFSPITRNCWEIM